MLGFRKASGILEDGSFGPGCGQVRERREGVREREGSRNRLYVRVDGSSVVDRHVAIRRQSTAGSRQGCSNAKRRHGQSHDELLELHVVSEWRCVVLRVLRKVRSD